MEGRMAEEKPSIFNKRATEKLRSPDDLDKFIRVANPSVWLVLTACIALLAGLLMWGVFGTVSTSVSVQGVLIDEEPICFLPAQQAARVHDGDIAKVETEVMEVDSVSKLPISREEVKDMVKSDFLASSLVEGDWVYVVALKGDGVYDFERGVPLDVNITTERIAPLMVLFGESQ